MTNLEKLTEQYLPQVKEIEKQAHLVPWSNRHLDDINGKFHCHRVLVVDGNVVGYFYAQCIVGEATLLNIAVKPSQQGNGFGRQLLQGYIETVESLKADSSWLEVRSSNLAAFALYEAEGFNEVTRRYDYYPTENGHEDAIVMSYLHF
ncbi:ribosomal protein S18-alanine N-acetyltransferase [Vibrio sp. SS-MA-C1-2]|uniref:ribosomal protein S18-alanine N-acetyltransferase n=1 Tax=Vibrio sp. SS-MA-C1-2 TaxID=2908646 RepID=UPI001F38F523|nr:ribosomal protein S18-alanine N-acetyltransferase [Vibrio sp. SS-MA-C1-2]UJF19711.1 ribosomal protein S18-alanine N-acetyltransferase [Vibrio sp. SS-MA-C1-2]